MKHEKDPRADESPIWFPPSTARDRETSIAPRADHPLDEHPIDAPFQSFPDPT